jgi:hypothetical protein
MIIRYVNPCISYIIDTAAIEIDWNWVYQSKRIKLTKSEIEETLRRIKLLLLIKYSDDGSTRLRVNEMYHNLELRYRYKLEIGNV